MCNTYVIIRRIRTDTQLPHCMFGKQALIYGIHINGITISGTYETVGVHEVVSGWIPAREHEESYS